MSEIDRLPTRPVTTYSMQQTDQVVIVYGTIGSGFQISTPFTSEEAAKEWINLWYPTLQYEILDLYEPTTTTYLEKYNPDLETHE